MDIELSQWIDNSAVWLVPTTYVAEPDTRGRLERLDVLLDSAQVVFLGETNHFVHEKADFRLWWLKHLSKRHRLVIGEELGWSDGRRIADYLVDGDERHIASAGTFGNRGHLRDDRNDWPTGVFAGSKDSYPYEQMKSEHTRFYRELRKLNSVDDYFGFDIDSPPGGAYQDLARHRDDVQMPEQFWKRLARVPGESLQTESQRLRQLEAEFSDVAGFELLREDLLSLIESLEYTALFKDAADYEATRPAMAYREQSMKRRIDDVMGRTHRDQLIVLMGHAFHLAKNDQLTAENGVGPGGGRVSSLGHYLVQEQRLKTAAVWMIYGNGRDSQPLSDLPRDASYSEDTINAALLRDNRAMVLPLDDKCPFHEPVRLGHLYNLVAEVHLCKQVDAVMFLPTVSPLNQ